MVIAGSQIPRYEMMTRYTVGTLKKEQELQDEKYKDALTFMLNNSKNTEDAKLLMEALGYLPYPTFARVNNRVTASNELSTTNGYLERIGKL